MVTDFVFSLQAVDIFASSSSSCESRLLTMKEIAKIWEVAETEADTLLPPSKPIIQDLQSGIRVGRIFLERTQAEAPLHDKKRNFVDIRSSLHLLERIACSVKYNEPVLLVGETGTGKTTLVQNLARRLGQPLTVLNLSQQSDVADLLGGLKPIDPRSVYIPLYNDFVELFRKTFSEKDNMALLNSLGKLRSDKNWMRMLKSIEKVWSKENFQNAIHGSLSEAGAPKCGKKRKRPLTEEVRQAWERFSDNLRTSLKQVDASSPMVFSFVEGAFISALRNGHWILLDEVNLAPPETLQRVMGVLEGENGSLCLAERGDVRCINRHPDFRIFACMNPATDAGKRDLPYSLRSRFTAYFVDEILDAKDLSLFVNQLMDHPTDELVKTIVGFYINVKRDLEVKLQDGASQKAQFSLRSLYRALEYLKKAEKRFGDKKALYDGFCMFFLTLLDGDSAKFMKNTILSHLLGGKMPANVPFEKYLAEKEEHPKPAQPDSLTDNYIKTNSVQEHLRNLARAILIKRYPVLLQGPTSSGKTSLVRYLASVTGHDFVRINNHEHTDLQEYLGSYVTGADGKIVFQEGVLVKAVRNGYWIVLDELNLAPSDVLEALNRLLDDNRELFVPELQETVQAHPNFMLFATQNPPTFYGGRKILSRAFRNRFVEIHVDEIPEDELKTILEKRCKIPLSYAKKMVEVMQDLQLHRQSSKVFAGKHGFITPRDLFRWANRFRTYGCSYEDLAIDGYFLLAERLRDESEKTVVQEVLEKRLHVKLDKEKLYIQESAGEDNISNPCNFSGISEHLENVTWTKSMQRLYFLVKRCYNFGEPVLLVGETGGGKTTVCQLLRSKLKLKKLHILNCHQYTETSDFLGVGYKYFPPNDLGKWSKRAGFYPVRDRSKIAKKFKDLIEQLMESNYFRQLYRSNISSDIGESSTLHHLNIILDSYKHKQESSIPADLNEDDKFKKMVLELVELGRKWRTIFTWQDGPLVQAMKDGDLFLVDEISLADDSVLERLNSVLEPEKQLTLAEKGGPILEKVTAHQNFFLLATMNPGGDFGKKELSPALRNRFTEIWVSPVSERSELESIAVQRLLNPMLVAPMLNFWEWFNQPQTSRSLTVRDLLSWVEFINVTEKSLKSDLSAFLHGAFLVLLDGLSLGMFACTGLSRHDSDELRRECFSFLLRVLEEQGHHKLGNIFKIETYGWSVIGKLEDISEIVHSDHLFGIHPFYIQKVINLLSMHSGDKNCETEKFELRAPTTGRNAMRVLRAMQLAKPILLEGSPGVGKTSLIISLAKFSGHKAVRINLSEQTDIMDLLGSDLPVHDDEGMKFAWSDGILLQALKSGDWVLLDELNLAPQAGLNAILDHRAEVFIPELGETFKCPPSFRVFACQNPSCQGGGRKGLPKSFLNRFTKVYVDELVENDYEIISKSLHPSIPVDLLSKLISFNKRLYEDTMVSRKYGQDGAPWEFNLRDVIRSCQILEGAPDNAKMGSFLNIVYIQRMRTAADRHKVLDLYKEVFDEKKLFINISPRVQISPHYLTVGNSCIKRNHFQPSKVSKSDLHLLPRIRYSLEAVVNCVNHNWLSILVGPSSSGKTSLVKLLAQLTGNVLHVLNLSQATDISDLLGCFEQYQASRNFHSVIAQVEKFINEYCSLSYGCSLEILVHDRKEVVSKWLAFLTSVNYSPHSSSASTEVDSMKFNNSLDLLDQIIEQLKYSLESNKLSVSWSKEDLDKIHEIVANLQGKNLKPRLSAKFEWVTGLLIKAIECGEWVVLENANLCNPTVLDRINSLVESSGSITINECGLVDGRPVVHHPHSKFRLFLTVNPKYGEVSRAMRNRGVEVFMMDPYWLGEGNDDHNCIELRDVKRFLALSGIPTSKLVDTMAEAHMIAKDTGVNIGVQISLLELTRWVQLFQQLVMKGNKPVWSLRISWNHTYLSSLGESEGRAAVENVKGSFYSALELSKLDTLGCSLPGGWPSPLKLTDFLWYSKEVCVKQNCMYLEFLGAQCASFQINHGTRTEHISSLVDEKQLYPSLIPLPMLRHILFPTTLSQRTLKDINFSKFDLALADRMLFFAANWTVEQATDNDLELYLVWFRWYDLKLGPYCRFFKSYYTLLEQVRVHPIWKCTIDGRRENCVGLLGLSFQQWIAEDNHSCDEETLVYAPLQSLRKLEREVLDELVNSQFFDLLPHLYTNLLESHVFFWNGVITKHMDCAVIAWRHVTKDLKKLQNFFPNWAESEHLVNVLNWNFHLPKSLLWVRGGHPFLPSSAKMYYIMQLLLWVSGLIWSTKAQPSKHIFPGCDYVLKEWMDEGLLPVSFLDNIYSFVRGNCFMKDALSANLELRHLAMQGVCMSSYLRDDEYIVQLLGMLQRLSLMLRAEKNTVEVLFVSDVHTSVACCTFSSELLCSKKYFSSWQEILPLFDNTSFFLDAEALEMLSSNIFVDGKALFLGLSCISQFLESTMDFSLDFSSRPPTDFVPHQRILWTLDEWESVDSDAIFVSSVLEMWFNWHSSLWNYCPKDIKIAGYDSPLPCMLFQSTTATTLDQILHCPCPIKDYEAHCLKLRVVSRHIWHDSASGRDIFRTLSSASRSLFQQVIIAHKKSFKEEDFSRIVSIFRSVHGTQMRVREECDYMAGRSSTADDLCQRAISLDKLEMECKRLHKKVVFRPNLANFSKLNTECADFMRVVTSVITLTENLEFMDLQQMNDQAINCQETATSFVNRLSHEYGAYVDIVQPIQVAVYEMKLGLAMIVSSALQRAFLKKSEQNSVTIMIAMEEAIYSFIIFPRLCSSKSVVSKLDSSGLLSFSSNLNMGKDMNLLKKLLTRPRDASRDEMVSVHNQLAALYHNIFVRITDYVGNSLVMEQTSFKLLKDICDLFDDLWMKMKVQRKEKDDLESKHFKFKPRAFKVEDIFKVDISTLRSSFSDESLCLEWHDMMVNDESNAEDAYEGNENLETEWGSIQESILKNVVHVHNLIFGSSDLVECPGTLPISNASKLDCFLESYELGMVMVKESEALCFSSLDTKLMPEHLLRLCLEYEKKFGVSPQQALGYNVYKALSGLQFLLSKVQMLEETAPKFSLSDQLQPIIVLVSSWQKMEVDSWPSLLDGVQEQYVINAGKLWFPLYSILHRGQTADIAGDNRSTGISLEEFIQTSSIGEFKRRLQLLLAFHGQINIGMCLSVYSSPMLEILKILYNVFGYYMQFLPVVLDLIEANKNKIAKELAEIVKLYRWDRSDPYLSMQSSKRTRQKFRKLIRKFNDILQQPIKTILEQDAVKNGIKIAPMLGPTISNDIPDTRTEITLPVSVDLALFSEAERSMWIDDWKKKVNLSLQNFCFRRTSGSDLKYLHDKNIEDIVSNVMQSLTPQSVCFIYEEEWSNVWSSLEHICSEASRSADLWNDFSKNFGKRRALSTFLKLLKECGLVSKDELESKRWLDQPSHDVHHLLLFKVSPDNKSGSNWNIANQYYFKSIAMVQQLRQICLNFHKDFSRDEVNRSSNFVDHLITIQQEQRSMAYGFAEHLESLRKCTTSINYLSANISNVDRETSSENSIAHNQGALHKCMWQQKDIFDSLYAVSYETSLMLNKIESNHLNACQSVRTEANRVLLFIEKFIPKLEKSKESLNRYLLNSNGVIIRSEKYLPPLVVSKQMEQLIMQNFQEIEDFEKEVKSFLLQSPDRKSVKETLLERFIDILDKGKAIREDFHSILNSRNRSVDVSDAGEFMQTFANIKDVFTNSFIKTLKMLRNAFNELCGSSNGHSLSKSSPSMNITGWKTQVESFRKSMALDSICEDIRRTIISAVGLLDHAGHRFPQLYSQIHTYLNQLSLFVDILLTLGDGFLLELIAMHRTVAEMTHMLACMFASLYSNGFGGPSEEQPEGGGDIPASGTGMGEGAGRNDVSEQINDEEQLLGASDKPDGPETSNEVPSKNDKGIETEQEFIATTCSVSEDSESSDADDDVKENVDSEMGDTGDKKDKVDEKLCDKNEDEDGNPKDKNDKYESGPTVRDVNSGSRELRAKDDSQEPSTDDQDQRQKNGVENQKDPYNDENMEDMANMDDMTMDKDSSFEDPSGLELDEQIQELENEMAEPEEGPAATDETYPEDFPTKDENDEGEEIDSVDENMLGADSDEGSRNVEESNSSGKGDYDENAEKNLDKTKTLCQLGKLDLNGEPVPGSNSATKPNGDAQALGEPQWSNRSNMQNGVSSSKGLPTSNDLEIELSMPDSSESGQLTSDQPKAQSLEPDSSSVQKSRPNPSRSVGDALEKWLESVKVAVDVEEQNKDATVDMDDGNADEYGFVSKLEKGTSQTLGPASSDQIDRNIKGSKPDGEETLTEQKENIIEMEDEKQNSGTYPLKSCTSSTIQEKKDEKNMGLNKDILLEEPNESDDVDDDFHMRNLSGDHVSVKKPYMNEDMLQLSNLSMNDKELGTANNHEEIPFDKKATARWRKYELKTTRLSQELAEQLRLVMEPTLASKLQGDFRTGKRINMKRVIPYIASDFRKDKIWLRRNQPNKRDYQVVVAVDDSRSMSESNCGKVAIEALVTVCRAMSQVEVGQLAVASFGKKGNVKLLHDFNQPFTGEAGIKMISSLKFEQENTIVDEPVVDLLKYLNNMLDSAVTNARLSSGQNPLQQLILIIADGRFHEKERLKRCVMDVLNKKRMVAFILIDSPEESIMDFMEASFQGTGVTFEKYLKSFPFPYYIILKNIEALPRTLADLLRQWFELISTRD
ncbi:hypothetical protein GIB67_009210 [Kingdonia uniflora]|uniref:Midasin n=1 Tax=Kingdonia uniflora TaxID=39325 RepID=A0A7J7N2F9_9MAGN|nr:hypothetical protein GIB67_009210 [Kingdonia uniflora]